MTPERREGQGESPDRRRIRPTSQGPPRFSHMRRNMVLVVLAFLVMPTGVLAQQGGGQGKISIAAGAEKVRFGGTVTLSGKLTGKKPTAGQTVAVESLAPPYTGAYATATTVISDADGNWSAVVTPAATARWRATAQTTPPRTSDEVTVGVKLRVTRRVSDSTPDAGERVRFRGRVRPAHDGATAKIQRLLPDGTWTLVAATTLKDAGDERSRYAKRVKVDQDATYRVRVPAPDADHLLGTSRRKTLDVG